jgi:hypothetical protein
MDDPTLMRDWERMDGDPRFRCNICGDRADFIVQLELVEQRRLYDALHSEQMPFYLCKDHEYVYKKMQQNIDMKNYFPETIRENL